MNILQIINLGLLLLNLFLAFYIINRKNFQIKLLKEENSILRKELYKLYGSNCNNRKDLKNDEDCK